MRICVFCSSSSAGAEAYLHAARELGREIARRGHGLIYGGADEGLMGALARAVQASGGHVIGVVPQRFVEAGLAAPYANELIVTSSVAERKAAMESRAQAFIALPGGLGTLEELLEVITLKQWRYLDAPIVLLNTADADGRGGFYDDLLAHWERLYREGLANEAQRRLYAVVATAAEALDYVETAISRR
ncbi:MAG: TIGR00730 family Rossman fold protein [Chloroflexota bacterium]